jgi:AraC-like DNA-binding protein
MIAMIKNFEVSPSPLLQPYIKSFSLREFDSSTSIVSKPLHANHEIYMTFYLNDKAPLPVNYKGGAGDQSFIFGLQTDFHGVLHFSGHFRLFCIVFRPNGFYKLFGVPPGHFTNLISAATGIFSAMTSQLELQLQEAATFQNMVTCAEIAMTSCLRKVKYKDPYNSIETASNLLLQYSGNISIEWLAYESNMSIKTFERAFTTQVGIAPKLFGRIARFNTALSLKLMDEIRDWTSIAHQCGYFDQMHLIKDFKRFAGAAPSRFFKTSPPPKETIQNSSGMSTGEC